MNQYRSIPKPGQKKTVHIKRPSPAVKQINRTVQRKRTTVIRPVPVVYKPKSRPVSQSKAFPATISKTVILNRTKKAHKQAKVRAFSHRVNKSNIIDYYRPAINRLQDIGINKILVMIACGPSILEAPLEKFKNHPTIDTMCINKPDMRVWPSTYWAFCDQSQYLHNKELFESYRGTIINSGAVKARRENNQIIIKARGGIGWSRNLTYGFHIGRSTVYANMQTALWMNYKKVYIFGIDMCRVGNLLHFYGVNPDVKENVRVKRFQQEAENYAKAYNVMEEHERRKFVMCSSYNPWPFANNMFERMDHKVAIDKILKEANAHE